LPEQVNLAVEVFRMLADAIRVQLLWEMLEAKCQSTSWRTLSGNRRMLQVDPGRVGDRPERPRRLRRRRRAGSPLTTLLCSRGRHHMPRSDPLTQRIVTSVTQTRT
jgi:hypothetical protein